MSEDVTRTVMVDAGTEALRMKRFLLTIHPPDEPVRHRVFGARRVTFGSSPDNDVTLDDDAVSRRHCELQVEAAGYRLRDLDSKNGTYIGDTRISDAWLRSGATIAIGGTTIRFETTDDDVEVLLSGRNRFGALVGRSEVMREIFATLERVAETDARVLLEGPPGTGKAAAAEAIHGHSRRRGGELVVFDASAVSPRDAERELFGDGAGVTGALEDAAAGTLYLVEPQALPPEVQARLARALESGEVRRGGPALTARIVSATDGNPLAEVDGGDLREDLYYLLSVVRIALPPLRDRPGDIPFLVEHFLDVARRKTGNESLNVTYATMQRLEKHGWPGNVAELRNFIDRAVALASADAAAEARFLGVPAIAESGDEPERAVDALMRATGVDVSIPFKDAKGRLVDAFERAYWRQLLERTGGNASAAARIAGLHRKSVEYILRKHEISRKELLP